MYLTVTISDLPYSIHLLSQFMEQLRNTHFDLAYKIMRDINYSPGRGPLYSSDSILQLNGYYDSG